MAESREEIYKETYNDPKFYSYQKYDESLRSMKQQYNNNPDSRTKSLVVLHLDLLYHKDVDKKVIAHLEKKGLQKV